MGSSTCTIKKATIVPKKESLHWKMFTCFLALGRFRSFALQIGSWRIIQGSGSAGTFCMLAQNPDIPTVRCLQRSTNSDWTTTNTNPLPRAQIYSNPTLLNSSCLHRHCGIDSESVRSNVIYFWVTPGNVHRCNPIRITLIYICLVIVQITIYSSNL